MASDIAAEPGTGCRVLVFGAHPDDAEIFAGGLLIRHCRAGSAVKIVSVTDGRSGHHQIAPESLVAVRRREAANAGNRIGAEYVTWDFPDGRLEPSLEVREAIIREIREFKPDLILTHRPCDYHPDHRAVGVAVQDACYMVTVPHVCPDVEALRSDPVVAYMVDLFTRPNPLRPDVVLDVAAEFDLCVQMAACHESQVFQWLPYHAGVINSVPDEEGARYEWLREWLADFFVLRMQAFEPHLHQTNLREGCKLEVYEVSEYAQKLTETNRNRLFPSDLNAG